MKLVHIFLMAIFLVLGTLGNANPTGLWAPTGQIILSGTPIGTVPLSVPITSIVDGHYFSEGSCKDALERIKHTPVTRATSSAQGLYYDAFTIVDREPVGTPGTEMKFNPVAGVTKTMMATCVPIGQ